MVAGSRPSRTALRASMKSASSRKRPSQRLCRPTISFLGALEGQALRPPRSSPGRGRKPLIPSTNCPPRRYCNLLRYAPVHYGQSETARSSKTAYVSAISGHIRTAWYVLKQTRSWSRGKRFSSPLVGSLFSCDLQGKLRGPKRFRHQGRGLLTATRQIGTPGRVELRWHSAHRYSW